MSWLLVPHRPTVLPLNVPCANISLWCIISSIFQLVGSTSCYGDLPDKKMRVSIQPSTRTSYTDLYTLWPWNLTCELQSRILIESIGWRPLQQEPHPRSNMMYDMPCMIGRQCMEEKVCDCMRHILLIFLLMFGLTLSSQHALKGHDGMRRFFAVCTTYISCIVIHLGISLEKWQCTLYIRSRYWRTRETQTRRQQSTNCLLPLLLLVGNEHISLGETIQPEISQSYGHFPYPLSSPGIYRRFKGGGVYR